MSGPNSLEVTLNCPYAEAVERVTEALRQEGFGVLTRIDIHEALREKLGVEFRPYTILGACNPPLAHRALSAEPRVGLMLPCNVTVEAAGEHGAIVRFADPEEMMTLGGFAGDERIAPVGREAAERIGRAAEALRT